MNNALDFDPLTIHSSAKQFGHRWPWSALWNVRVSNRSHMPIADQRCIVSGSADTGNFHPCSRFQTKDRARRESNENAAC